MYKQQTAVLCVCVVNHTHAASSASSSCCCCLLFLFFSFFFFFFVFPGIEMYVCASVTAHVRVVLRSHHAAVLLLCFALLCSWLTQWSTAILGLAVAGHLSLPRRGERPREQPWLRRHWIDDHCTALNVLAASVSADTREHNTSTRLVLLR